MGPETRTIISLFEQLYNVLGVYAISLRIVRSHTPTSVWDPPTMER